MTVTSIQASIKSRAEILKSDAANNIANDRLPFVTTFHPSNLDAEKIISRNFRILREDSTTSDIFNKPPLKAFRCPKNLKDMLVRSSLPRNLPHQSPGTFPCRGVPLDMIVSSFHGSLQPGEPITTEFEWFARQCECFWPIEVSLCSLKYQQGAES